MNKLLCMHVAATLASGVLANLPDNLPLNADITDPNVKAENLMQWELFRIFYHGVVAALQDDKSWPSPPADTLNLNGLLQGGLQGLLDNPVVKDLLSRLGKPTS
jgi:hypothetical protein